MENSKAYKDFIQQTESVGANRLDGYDSTLLEKIYDWERDNIEEIIWNRFNNNDLELAVFLLKLKKYDGNHKLQEALNNSSIPSHNSLNIALVLLDYFEDKKYISIIQKNIKKFDEKSRVKAISKLIYVKNTKLVLGLLEKYYINDKSRTVRNTALTGVLLCKGYIKNPLDIQETFKTAELRELFLLDNLQDRKYMIDKLNRNKIKVNVI